MFSAFRRWQRQQTASGYQVDDEAWLAVEQHLPFLSFLDDHDRPRLRRLALEFLAGKEISGAHGLEVTNPMRLAIALQACLLVLNIGLDAYEDWVGIVVYPGDFVIPRNVTDEAGVVHEYDDPVLGEAWQGGPVLLSWFDEEELAEGINVVIHEFAHKLDMRNGEADGMPELPPSMDRRGWSRDFSEAYEDFCLRVDEGEEVALDPYGAEHPAEFFAVMSEAFFETPLLLQEEYPAVYARLAGFYRLDPAQGERRMNEAGHA